MEDRSEAALIALRRILRATEHHSRALANQSGLTVSQIVLMQIVEHEGRAMPSRIAHVAGLTQATVTSLIDRLERAGLATRQRDTEDRRRIWIALTDRGRQAAAAAPDLLQDRFRKRFAALEDWEQAMIVAALERISMLLGAGLLDAAPVLDIGDIAPRHDD